jgi:hypothetical protein
MAMAYTTYGDIRGCCGHRHKTIETAETCLGRDQRGCASRRGYSDRSVVRIGDDGNLYDLSGEWVPGPGGRSGGAARFTA